VRYLSVCSGIEAATVAWHGLGWTPVAFSEIEPFPSAVLQHHYPHVPNLGDMTNFKEWNLGTVDLLVGGTPCQSFSVAGLRKGLEDPRGNLMLTYLAIAQRYRPRWLVWENVPGVLSSNGGRDFGTFLGALGELGYGWAYRVLDAQWFGVAQRRRRVFVVGYLGDWQRAAQVLFERESVQRNPAPSREARQGAAAGVAQCFAGSRQSDVAATLETTAHDYSRADGFNMVAQYLGNAEGGAREVPFLTCHNLGGTAGISNQTPLVAHALRAEGFDASEDGTGRGTPLVPVVFKVRGGVEREDGSRGSTNIGKQAGKGYLGSEERAFTLAAAQDQFVAQPIAFQSVDHGAHAETDLSPTLRRHDPMAVAQPIPIHDQATRHAGKRGEHSDGKGNGLGIGQPGDPAPTLTKGDKHAVAFHENQRGELTVNDTAGALKVGGGKPGQGYPAVAVTNGSHWDDPRNPHPTLNQASQGSGAIGYGNQELFSQRGGGLVPQPIAIHPHVVGRAPTAGPQGKEYIDDGSAYCMDARGVPQSVAQPVATDIKQVQWASGGGQVENDTAQALRSNAEYNYQFARVAMQVRRLTPVECERLQGFPDGYTNIAWRKKPEAPDGPRYKALGNSMAVPCMAWIGKRIAEADRGD